MNSIRQKFVLSLTKLGDFLLQGRREATIAAMLTAVIPYLGWASLAIVAFVTLRKGTKDGLFVLAWSSIPAIIGSYLMNGSVAMAAESIVAYLLIWGLSLLLRATASWRYVLEVSFGFCLILIILFYWFIPDLNQIYVQYILDLYRESATTPDSYTDAQSFVEKIVVYLLGVQISLYMLHTLLALLIARALQAIMFNPEGLSQELKMIRLDVGFLVLAALVAFAGLKMSYNWAIGAFPVFIVVYLLAGFSLIHYAIKQKIRFKGIILLFYILFVFLFPFSLIPVILLAFGDTIWNIRRFL